MAIALPRKQIITGLAVGIFLLLVIIIARRSWNQASPVNCTAFRIEPPHMIHHQTLTRYQISLKSHFHKQQMKHQIVTDDVDPHTFFQRNWEPSYSCTTLARFGCPGDGGKWICDPHRLLLDGCTVYSIGSNDDFSFEEAIHHFNPQCEIHTFDPTLTSAPVHKPAYVHFHPWGLGSLDSADNSGLTLSTIMRRLGHNNITVLKVDCEGCEFDSFKTHSFTVQRGAIQQILVEVHWIGDPLRTHAFFKFLTSRGYGIFNKEANLISNGNTIEYALVFLGGGPTRYP